MHIYERLKQSIVEAIARVTELELAEIAPLVERPKKREFGDLAFPCFPLAKARKVPPAAVAQSLAETLSSPVSLPLGVVRVKAVGAFLNFFFDRLYVVREIVYGLLNPPTTTTEQPRKTVVVEYSSPNIAKPFHVGHLRATLIGNCLDRVYRYLGWNTVSVNHLGDWGTQFGFVWAGCKLWGFPENPTVSSLVDLYRRATALKAEQEASSKDTLHGKSDVNEMAREYFLDLERGEDYAVSFWKQCVDVSLEYLRATYKRLGVRFDHYVGESFYSDKLEEVRLDLEQAGLLTQSQGAQGVDLGETLGFARILTADGRSLYLTRDLATAKYRAGEFQFDRAVYVVGAPQSLHFQQLKAILRALGRDYAEKILHVAFGHVQGMKTRGGGNFIELNEFLDEAYNRALESYRTQVNKRPEGLDEAQVARGVALSALICSNLSRTNIKDVHFSWKHALEFQGDTGPYLMYACARINGITEKAAQAGITESKEPNTDLLTEDSGFQLASKLVEFHEVVKKTAEENEPAYLASYALELAKVFSKAYLELQVVGQEPALAQARLALFEATRKVLVQALALMGIEALERM